MFEGPPAVGSADVGVVVGSFNVFAAGTRRLLDLVREELLMIEDMLREQRDPGTIRT